MDEPFVGVDAVTEKAIVELLKELRDEQKTVIVVHHDLQTINEYFDWVFLLNVRQIAFGKVQDTLTEEKPTLNIRRTTFVYYTITQMNLVIDYPVIITLIGVSLIGITSGIISCYSVLKEQSLLGDAIAHAALPGLCIAFLITLNKNPIMLMLGAICAGLLGTIFITTIIQKSILKEDTALGVILSVFFDSEHCCSQ